MPSALISVRLFIRGHGGFTLQWPWDRGQIDSRARAFRPHHRSDRRRGIPAGPRLSAHCRHITLEAAYTEAARQWLGKAQFTEEEIVTKLRHILG